MAAFIRQSLRSLALRPVLAVARPFVSRLSTVGLRPFPSAFVPSGRVLGAARAFSVAGARFSSQGLVDQDLAHKLEQEISYEKDNVETETPEFVKEFIEHNSFKIHDKPGHDEVILTRTFGCEKIRVLFSISDINNNELDEDFSSEELSNEFDSASEEEEEESFPVRCSVIIEKENKGAVSFDTLAQDGTFMIESIVFYHDPAIAGDQSAEADWKRRGLYMGPQFSELDEGVQVLFERYLEERGINTALAHFIPDYIEHKEQREYLKWLESVREFVAA